MRILVVKLSSMGDLFHALPALHILRDKLGAEIDWAVQQEYVELVRCFTDIRRVIPVRRRPFLANVREVWRAIRAERYDLALDMQGLLKSALVLRMARAGRYIGPSFEREGARCFYGETAGRREKERHAVEENLDFARHLGLAPEPVRFPVRFPDPGLADANGPRVAVVPVSRWPTKNWPLDRFVEVARRLATERGATVYAVGGPGDVRACERIVAACGAQGIHVAGRTTLVELGGLLGQMDAVLSNDSGPVHMAAAMGIPCVVLFGPTRPERTGPYGPGHCIVRSRVPCSPCYRAHCASDLPACWAGIGVQDVLTAVLGVLDRTRT